MKTIFMMLSRGIVARNMLQTKVLDVLMSRKEVRLILFVPENIPSYFIEEFDHPRILLQTSEEVEYPRYRKLFERILQKLVYSSTSKFFMRYGGRPPKKNKTYISYIFGHLGAVVFSRCKFLIPVFRWLELRLFRDTHYDHFFEMYKPDLVISTIMKTKRDVSMLKSARQFKIPSIGMTRSWDNLDRMLVPFLSDRIVVQNDAMKEIGVDWHGIDKDKIFVTGFPQFDLYYDSNTFVEHLTFLKERGLSPERKTIFFGSEGVWAPYGVRIARILADLVNGDKLVVPTQLIVRPHFSDIQLDSSNIYDEFEGLPNVYYDKRFRASKFFTDKWDPTFKEMKNLANELKHSDILITYASTLSLEASILDTPVINIDYRTAGEPNDGPFLGCYYKSSHYARMANSGALKLVKSTDELLSEINKYLLSPENQSKERDAVAKWLAPHAGESGKRLGNYILDCLDNLKV